MLSGLDKEPLKWNTYCNAIDPMSPHFQGLMHGRQEWLHAKINREYLTRWCVLVLDVVNAANAMADYTPNTVTLFSYSYKKHLYVNWRWLLKLFTGFHNTLFSASVSKWWKYWGKCQKQLTILKLQYYWLWKKLPTQFMLKPACLWCCIVKQHKIKQLASVV